ncbi:HD domain-containing protein [Qipengyuania sp. 902]|uniref:HD domain-containing protein n=1 Tax=Qipengyuania sp. 902 TaxID=3417565 RepID=UPI003EB70DD9
MNECIPRKFADPTSRSNTDNQILLEAVCFAAERHRHQRRKDAGATPYVNHPLEVARILTQAGVVDLDVLLAALLHDTIEDTDTTVDEITQRFGERVSGFVLEVTDDKRLPKAERKRRQVESATGKSDGAKMIKLADKIANLRDLSQSPPRWTSDRMCAYRIWAHEVVSGCCGVNRQLDEWAAELCGPDVTSLTQGGA